ncbi:hypothetical protein BSU01_17765 [Erwinia billingiae]|uniref:hypothetical protein n=1 Tax=Erwinia billingiae TaxID=182337 RepID=UPI0019D082CC|nr:hypothetical protein [Erwinia billingiae]MBN7123534.1 hypothetical protein [Erwinia billingiae]
MNSTVKLLVEKIIHKAFPEFSNKVTWTLITVGIAILIFPVPTYVMFINLIIDLYNNTAHTHVGRLDIGSFTPNTGAAITLILSGLIYHLAVKGIQIYGQIYELKTKENNKITEANIEKEKNEKLNDADIKLFSVFTSLLPANSTSIELLKDHHFGNSYHDNHLKDIEGFTYRWGKADQHFHDSELEIMSQEFFEEAKRFLNFLALSSGYIQASSLLSIPTDTERANDWDLSENTAKNIKKANEWSLKLHELYCNFVTKSKKNLLI